MIEKQEDGCARDANNIESNELMQDEKLDQLLALLSLKFNVHKSLEAIYAEISDQENQLKNKVKADKIKEFFGE